MATADLNMQYVDLQYQKLKYQYLNMQICKYHILAYSIQHSIVYTHTYRNRGGGFLIGFPSGSAPRQKFVTPIARDIYVFIYRGGRVKFKVPYYIL